MPFLDINCIRNYLSTQPVLRAWLFGSYARGDANSNSDVDLLVVFDKKARVGLLRHADMIITLEELLGKSVDLVSEGSLYPEIKKEVDKYKKLIYERKS